MIKPLPMSLYVGMLAFLAAVVLINTVNPLMGEPVHLSMYVSALIGSFGIGCPVGYYLTRQKFTLTHTIAELHQARDHLAMLNEKLELRARTDSMTGVLSREAFFDDADDHLLDKATGAMLIIDIDHFKMINDTFGHLAGDRAIAAVAKAIVQAAGATATVGRIGGEEFAVTLPEADAEQAFLTAQNIKYGVEELAFYPIDDLRAPLTVSIGGCINREGAIVEDLIRTADRKLYTSKAAGRNAVTIAEAA